MKIMFNITSLNKGGAERVISVLSNALSRHHEVSILIDNIRHVDYQIDSNVKIIDLEEKYISNALVRNLKRTKSSYKVIKKEKPDIIIVFLPIPSFRMLILKMLNKIPVIVADRNDPQQEYKGRISNILMTHVYRKL